MRSVVIIKIGALGDIVMATPLLTALHKAFPGVRVTWVVEDDWADILRSNPLIDQVIPVKAERWRRRFREIKWIPWLIETVRMRARIRAAGRPDAVICCHPEQGIWATLFCGARERVGLFPGQPGWTKRLYTRVVTHPPGRALHHTRFYLQGATALGADASSTKMLVPEGPGEATFADAFHAQHGIDRTRPVVIVAPFTTWVSKAWEPTRWVALIAWMQMERRAQVILTMGSRDGPWAREIAQVSRSLSGEDVVCAERTTVEQYMALVRHSDLVLCCDSSALHIAAAMEVPFIVLFGPTDPREIAPLTSRNGMVLRHSENSISCAVDPEGNTAVNAAMRRISIAEVQAAVSAMLSQGTGERREATR
jgi:heptosyltransferase-1